MAVNQAGDPSSWGHVSRLFSASLNHFALK